MACPIPPRTSNHASPRSSVLTMFFSLFGKGFIALLIQTTQCRLTFMSASKLMRYCESLTNGSFFFLSCREGFSQVRKETDIGIGKCIVSGLPVNHRKTEAPGGSHGIIGDAS